jgi:hypothetical protein
LPSSSLNQISPPLSRINLRSATYITAKEVKNKVLDNEKGFEDLNNITTNTDYNSEPNFDSLDNNAFDPILSGDYNTKDNFINVE